MLDQINQEERKTKQRQQQQQEVQREGRAGRFFKYIARKMGCARNDPPDARDDIKQRENEEDYRRAISAPRRSTRIKQQALTGEEENEQRRMNKMKQDRELELRNQKIEEELNKKEIALKN